MRINSVTKKRKEKNQTTPLKICQYKASVSAIPLGSWFACVSVEGWAKVLISIIEKKIHTGYTKIDMTEIKIYFSSFKYTRDIYQHFYDLRFVNFFFMSF